MNKFKLLNENIILPLLNFKYIEVNIDFEHKLKLNYKISIKIRVFFSWLIKKTICPFKIARLQAERFCYLICIGALIGRDKLSAFIF